MKRTENYNVCYNNISSQMTKCGKLYDSRKKKKINKTTTV